MLLTNLKKEKKSEGFGGGITYDEGTIYSTSGFGNVIAIDAIDGSELWRVDLRIPIRSAPISYNNIYSVIGIYMCILQQIFIITCV